MCLSLFCARTTLAGWFDPPPPQGARLDIGRQQSIQNRAQTLMPTPTDVRYSLERFNLIRRAYWINGMREKALSLPCPVVKPLGYIVLVTGNGSVLGSFVVDGKVSSLRQYLTPESELYASNVTGGSSYRESQVEWLADIDGCYGDNSEGIFFFTPDGKYLEWTGTYLYSDIPFTVKDPVLRIGLDSAMKGVEK